MTDSSFGERVWIVQGVEQNLRTDGRSRLAFRPLGVETNIIAQADGSARLHLGATDVLVGIKVELGVPDGSKPDQGQVHVSVECSSCASPEFKGRGGEDWGIELAQAIETSLVGGPSTGGSLDLKSLCVVPGRTCWVVHVDGLLLNDGGNALDALSIATRVALSLTRIPKVEVSMDDDDEPEVELTGDVGAPLDVSRVPIIVSVSQVGHQSVVDLSSEEEPCATASLSIAVNQRGGILGISKGGSGGLDPVLMQEMVEIAQKLGPGIVQQLEQYVAAVPATS